MGTENLFEIASRYFDFGFRVIPVCGKAAYWSEHYTMSHDELQAHLNDSRNWRHNTTGLGLIMGSNIVCLDIDTDNPEVLDALPISPAVKRGKKGETRFFRPSSSVGENFVFSLSEDGLNTRVEILARNKYTVLPPSIHPETNKPYVWTSQKVLPDFDLEDLPVLHLDDVQAALNPWLKETSDKGGSASMFTKEKLTGGPWDARNDGPEYANRHPSGSVLRLQRLAVAKICDGKTDNEAATELLQYDEKNHLPHGLFWPGHKERHSDRRLSSSFENAYKFSQKIRATLTRAAKKKGDIHFLAKISGEIVVEPTPDFEVVIPKKSIEPEGLLRIIRNLVRDAYQFKTSDNFAEATALAALSAISLGRYHLEGGSLAAWFLFVGPTSSGKQAGFDFVKDLIGSKLFINRHLGGLGDWRSGPGVVQELKKQRFRVDLVDEFSKVIIKHDKENVADAITQMLEIFGAPKQYLGLSKAGQNYGACWGPQVAVMAAIQPDVLQTHYSDTLRTIGLLPRFLVVEAGKQEANVPLAMRPGYRQECFKRFMETCGQDFVDRGLVLSQNEILEMPEQGEWSATKLTYGKSYVELKATLIEKLLAEREFGGKAGQHFETISALHAISRNSKTLERVDGEYAWNFIERCYATAEGVCFGVSEELRVHESIEEFVSSQGDKIWSPRDLLRAKRLCKKNRYETERYLTLLVKNREIEQITTPRTLMYRKI